MTYHIVTALLIYLPEHAAGILKVMFSIIIRFLKTASTLPTYINEALLIYVGKIFVFSKFLLIVDPENNITMQTKFVIRIAITVMLNIFSRNHVYPTVLS